MATPSRGEWVGGLSDYSKCDFNYNEQNKVIDKKLSLYPMPCLCAALILACDANVAVHVTFYAPLPTPEY